MSPPSSFLAESFPSYSPGFFPLPADSSGRSVFPLDLQTLRFQSPIVPSTRRPRSMDTIQPPSHHRNNQSIAAGHLTALSGAFSCFRSKQNHLADSDLSFFVAFRSAHPLCDKVASPYFTKFSIDRSLFLMPARWSVDIAIPNPSRAPARSV